MTRPGRLLPPLALAVTGAGFAGLAAADKWFGLVQRPLHLATLAYACLFLLLAWAALRGIPLRPARLLRLSLYTAFLMLNLLTAAYVFAWRISADPTPVVLQAQLHRGDALLAAGEKDAAHLVYREAYRRYPNSFPVLMRMGAVSYQIGDFERARKYFTRALETAPPDARWRALNDLGQTWWKLRDPETAIRLYQQARLAGMPDSETLEWHYRLAWAYFDARDYDAAIEHYRAVARAGAKYAAASYYNMACAQVQKLRRARTPEERRTLVRAAVDNLRRAWKAASTPEEVEALRKGLLGDPEERDPELAPLHGTPELARFLQELHSP